MKMLHPGKEIMMRLQDLGITQKSFSETIGKRVSEINELIKGKRNITIGWDFILSNFFHTEYKYWVLKQIDYDYEQFLAEMDLKEQFIERKREEKKNIEDNSSRKENDESVYNNIGNFQKREVSWWNTYPSAENSEYLNTEKKNWVNNPIEEKQQKQSISTNYLQEDVFKNF